MKSVILDDGVGNLATPANQFGVEFVSKGTRMDRRNALRSLAAFTAGGLVSSSGSQRANAAQYTPAWKTSIDRGLNWLANDQSPRGRWVSSQRTYPTAMTALSGTALLGSGSTTTQGPYAKHIRLAIDYLMTKVRKNGLIGDPQTDNRYTYGHGFAMLFLSQVLGEEEDKERREELTAVLQKAVEFSGRAQTKSGGWGYMSAKEGNNFDEGSTTITQVQGLRGCRNAGIPVSKEVIDKARQYIYMCKNPDGGISYSSKNRGASRPAITAASLASLYNAGDYDSKHVPQMMAYCKKNLYRLESARSFGHWHYTYLYYAQVVYREGGDSWKAFREKLYDRIVNKQTDEGGWFNKSYGNSYATAINLTILQLDKGILPIYQR